MKRRIALLGCTGSIGVQALDVIARFPGKFKVEALVAFSSHEALFAQVRAFRPKFAGLVVKPMAIPEDLRFARWVFGEDCAAQAARLPEVTDVLAAMVGIAGLSPVLEAIEAGKRILLANKEALVAGGELVMNRARQKGVSILPIDSEHSAIHQCLNGARGNRPRRLILTASGGALRDIAYDDLENAAPADVLAHPTWRMGKKITVDCATMVNKGLEVIEAHHLFGMDPGAIDVVIHPQSFVHSMVEFNDGALMAQLGAPDMRVPIAYALGWPRRLPLDDTACDLFSLPPLTFAAPEARRYPCLALAYDALRAGGSAPVALNAANEAAVEGFLRGQIPFGGIARAIASVLEHTQQHSITCLDDILEADRKAREMARLFMGQ